MAGGFAPAFGAHPVLLAEEGDEDAGLVGAEARQRVDPGEQVLPGGGAGPDVGGVAVVTVDDQLAQLLHAGGHRARVAVEGGALTEDRHQGFGVVVGQFLRGRLMAQPPHQVAGRGEGLLQRHLLIEQHADQQRQRAARQQLVGVGVDGQRERHGYLRCTRTILAGRPGRRDGSGAHIMSHHRPAAPGAAGGLPEDCPALR